MEFTKDEILTILSKTQDRFGEFDESLFMDDLINAVCLLIKDGLNYKFIHRSFQEYFVALSY